MHQSYNHSRQAERRVMQEPIPPFSPIHTCLFLHRHRLLQKVSSAFWMASLTWSCFQMHAPDIVQHSIIAFGHKGNSQCLYGRRYLHFLPTCTLSVRLMLFRRQKVFVITIGVSIVSSSTRIRPALFPNPLIMDTPCGTFFFKKISSMRQYHSYAGMNRFFCVL